MHPQLQAQLNVRNNVREMHDYVKDLYAWEADIKAKDDAIRKGKLKEHTRRSEEARVRGKAEAVKQTNRTDLHKPAPELAQGQHKEQAPKRRRKKKASAKTLPQKPADSAAGHTYDYFRDKWDKFDVDAALNEADEDTEYETDSEAETPVGQQQPNTAHLEALSTTSTAKVSGPAVRQKRSPEEDAEFWKTKGNEYYKFGDHAKAKECYSSSLQAVPSAVAHANRALACIKLREWDKAELDCSKAIELDPSYVKAWQRRALVRTERGDARASLFDLDHALRLVPASKAAATALRDALKRYAAANGLRLPSELAPVLVRGASPAAPAAPAAGEPSGLAAPQRSCVGAVEEDDLTCGRGGDNEGVASAGTGGASAQVLSPADIGRGAVPCGAVPAPRRYVPPLGAFRRMSASGAESGGGGAARVAVAPFPAVRNSSGGEEAGGAVKVPATSAEFEAAWRGFRGNVDRQAHYLRAIPPAQLPRIFKSALTPAVLRDIVEAVLVCIVPSARGPEQGVAVLDAMSQVDRFGMNVMLIPGKQKQVLRQAWTAAVSQLPPSAHVQFLERLRPLYKLA